MLFNHKGNKFLLSKKHKIVIGILAITILLGFIKIYISYAFYIADSSKNVIKGKIGEISSADLKINLYMETRNSGGKGTNTYTIASDVPLGGYEFNSSKSSCKNSSKYSYDAQTKQFAIKTMGQENCDFYFDALGIIDEEINILVQNKDKNGIGITNSYSLVDSIPLGGYKFNKEKSTCGASIYSYDEEQKVFNITTLGQDKCNFYFDVISKTDITIEIYSKKNCETSCTYKRVEEVPTYKTFNEEKSTCEKGTITFDGTNLKVKATGVTTCKAYFD